MAVRAFDLTDAPSASLDVLDRSRLTRREATRLRRRSTAIALVSVAAPFVVAVIVLGVGR